MQAAPTSDSIDPWPRDAVLRESRRPPPIAEVAVFVLASNPTHEVMVKCLAAADSLRDMCYGYLEWIRTGYAGPSTPLHRFSDETLH